MKYIHDIAHCNNDKCNKAKNCYRYQAYLEIKGKDILISILQNTDKICIAKNHKMFMTDN